jgi:PST family polysaccharide transporter
LPEIENGFETASAKPEPLNHDRFDRSLVHGLAWSGLSKWGTQLLAWASTLIVARILTPEDYGIVSLATVYLGLLGIVSEFGVSTAVVTLRDLTAEQISQLNGFSIILGFLGFSLTAAVAPLWGKFFSSPQLPAVLTIMGTGFILSSVQSVPNALLQRDLRFKTLSLIDGLRGLSLSLACVVFALMGFHYWTLVFGGLLSTTLATGAVLTIRRHSFAWPRFRYIKRALQFSSHVLVSRLCWYGYSNSDFLVAGRVLGQVALGSYTMAWTLASVPVEKIGSLIGGVAPAFFSALQTDKAALRKYFSNISEAIAVITFPVSLGMALEVREFVHLALGAKWEAAVVPLQLLSIYATVRSVAPVLAHILNVTGETRFGMQLSIVNIVFYPPAFYFASRWGAVGIAATWMVTYPFLNIPLFSRALKKLELPFSAYLRALRPALQSSAVMVIGVLTLKLIDPHSWSPLTCFIVEVLAGAALYTGTLVLFHRGRIEGMLRRIRAARQIGETQEIVL